MKNHDYISIFGGQPNVIVANNNFSFDDDATSDPETSSTTTIHPSEETGLASNSHSPHNKTILQLLHDLIRDTSHPLAPVSDDATSIPLLRREDVNSFVDGRMEMDDTGPNARDVSNAFGRTDSVLNSFGA